MARSSLNDVQGSIVDPAQTWNFDLFFEKLPSGISGSTSTLTIRCMSTSLPGVSFEPIEVELHGVKLKYRGRKTYNGTFSVTFAENVDWTTYNLFREWNNLMLSWERNTGSSSTVYKVPCTMTMYNDAGEEVATYTLKGVWPQDVNEISFNGAESSYVQLEVTFSFDYVSELD